MQKNTIILMLLIVSLTACLSPSGGSSPTPITVTATLPPTGTPTSIPSATPTNLPPTPVPITLRPVYTLTTTFDYDRHFVSVDETILYPNHTGDSLDTLTLAIAANLWPNCFRLESIIVDETLVTDFTLDGHRLDIPLPAPLESETVSELHLRYSLSLPYTDQAHSLRARIFGYGDLQTNLTNWYPFIVPFIDGEWIIREPWSHGEYLVYPLADFSLDLKFTNPENAPVVASSGAPEPNDGYTRYTLTASRAFALSASRDFEVASLKVGDIKVSSYYFPIYKRAGEGALIASKQAVEVFSQRFGPYPHKTLSIVIADFMDSMEYSALYFNSRYFYDQFDGTAQNYLTFVSVHETAHQWWFEQVANDQALEPWLDESLATYSEEIFYETQYPDLVSWWWSYRIDFFEPSGYIDIPVYQGQNDDTYKHSVYFNGAHFLRDLRARIGDEAFYAFIKDYFTQNKGKIANRNDFFTILDAHTDVDYSDILRGYFRYR
ncbi:MAG: M1 family metallopeptidase [Anaerolineales bacterium]|nr:M1 family metallopeptidase [Anaerolineales bacterium]